MRISAVIIGLLLGIYVFDTYNNHGRYADAFARMAYEIKRNFTGR